MPGINPDSVPESRLWRHLGLFGAAPLIALFALFGSDVPLGEPGHIVYRYSEMVPARLKAALVPILLAGGAAPIAFGFGASAHPRRQRLAMLLGSLLFAVLAGWVYFAPPSHRSQHSFNFESPSQDGAFVLESRTIESTRDYLARFPALLRASPEELRGTRVLSNPPGQTLLCLGVRRALQASPTLLGLGEKLLGTERLDDAAAERRMIEELAVAWSLTWLWAASIGFAYALGRLWLEPLPAAVMAFCSVFNPATVNFAPGKDPAQLLTIEAMLFLWFHSSVRGRRWSAFLSGVVGIVGAVVGLIHIWIGFIGVAAVLWDAGRTRHELRRALTGCLLPCGLGAVSAMLAAWFALSWNVPATLLAVARRYMSLRPIVGGDYERWLLMGIPLFLLFAGPGLWVLVAWTTRCRQDDGHALLGRAILLTTLGVMLATYLLGNNSELPRLWIAFIPLLIGSVSLMSTPFRVTSRAATRLLVGLLVCQIVVTALHWSIMDVRETEMRLRTGRLFW